MTETWNGAAPAKGDPAETPAAAKLTESSLMLVPSGDSDQPSTNPYRDNALDWYTAGWTGVLPLPERAKRPPPDGWTGRNADYPSYPDVYAWVEAPEHAKANLALRMPPGVIGIDVDDYDGKVGGDTLRTLIAELGPLPATWRITSRDPQESRSGILLFRVPDDCQTGDMHSPGVHIDLIRREHRYAVGPESIHPEGRPYRLYGPNGAEETGIPKPDDLPELPGAWVERMTKTKSDTPREAVTGPRFRDMPPKARQAADDFLERVRGDELARLRGAQSGERNNVTFAVAAALLDFADSAWAPYTAEDVEQDLLEHAPIGGGFTSDEVRRTLASARTRDDAGKGRSLPDKVARQLTVADGAARPDTPSSGPSSDSGAVESGDADEEALTRQRESIRTHADQAARVARDVLAGRWLWTRQLGWFRFDGKRWADTSPEIARRVITDHLRRYVQEHQEAIFAKARKAERGLTDEELDEIASLNRMLAKHFLDAVTSLAGPIVGIEPTEFDSHPELLNCDNGVLNLRTGELGPHDPKLYLRKITPVAYRPEALAHPDLTKVLDCVPDEATRQWLQVRFGQAATGYVPPDDRLLLLQGGGSNGKSTMTGLAMASLGEYAITVDDKVLLAEDNSHTTEKMDLLGARFGLVEEVPGGRELDTNKIKKIVGTPKLKARRMRMDPVEWAPTHALFVTTNTTPIVRAADHGAWRRLLRVNFPIRYREPSQALELPNDRRGDTALRARVEANDPALTEAFLAWIAAGAARWFADNRVMPPVPAAVLADTTAWQAETDLTYQFLTTQMVPDRGRHVLVGDFYERYVTWAESENHRPLAKNSFSTKVKEHPLWTKAGLGEATLRNHVNPSLLSRPDPHAAPHAGVARVLTGMRFRYASDDEDDAGQVGGPPTTW